MAIPTQADINKKEQDLAKHLKKLQDPSTGQQKRVALINMVRSALRQAWFIAPAKLAFMEMGVVPDLDPSTRTKWKTQCQHCEEWFKKDELECDHKKGEHSFREVEDFSSYFDNILDVVWADLQRLCAPCHGVKTYMEKEDLPDMKTSAYNKIGIFIGKSVSAPELTRLLKELNMVPESTIPKRKQQMTDWLGSLNLSEKEYMKLFESCSYFISLENKFKKSKKFKLSTKDLMHIYRWKSFWAGGNITPNTIYKVLSFES
jgi:hypothetical protein